MLDKIPNLLDKGLDTFNDKVETEKDRQATLTGRLQIDMNSDSWFAKSIRPLVTILTGAVWSFVTIYITFLLADPTLTLDWTLIATYYGSVTATFGTCIGFYFKSRRDEKIASRNADAHIKKMEAETRLEEMKTKSTIKKNRRQGRRGNKQ